MGYNTTQLLPNLAHPLNQGKLAWFLGTGSHGRVENLMGPAVGAFRGGARVSEFANSRPGVLGNSYYSSSPNNAGVVLCSADPRLNNLPLGDFSVAYWIWPFSTSATFVYVGKFNATTTVGWAFYLESAKWTGLVAKNGTNFRKYQSASTVPVVRQWQRLCWSYLAASGVLTLTSNGRSLALTSASAGTLAPYPDDTASALALCNQSVAPAGPSTGVVSDVCVWNRYLSATEAWVDYDESSTGYPGALLRRRSWANVSVSASNAPILLAHL